MSTQQYQHDNINMSIFDTKIAIQQFNVTQQYQPSGRDLRYQHDNNVRLTISYAVTIIKHHCGIVPHYAVLSRYCTGPL